MIQEEKYTKEFYHNLGKLFYAIAASDGDINEIELEILKRKVQEEWPTADNSTTILKVFKWLEFDQEYSADDCFNNFINYKNNNEHLFTDHIKQQIVKTCNAIAASFSRKNKAELMMLAKLSIAFTKKA